MVARIRPATLDDLNVTPDDGQIYELLNGEIVVSPAPTWKHELVSQALNRLLGNWATERDLGDVMKAPTDVVLSTGNALQPDILFVSYTNPARVINGRFHGAPELVVEIISPTSRDRDSGAKANRYAAEAVQEFWLIDPDRRRFAQFWLTNGVYAEHRPDDDGFLTSGVLPGLRFSPVVIFEQVEQRIRRRQRAG